MGSVYLLHFDKPYKRAGHYIGYTDDIDARLERHRKGHGAKIIKTITENGIGFKLARLWEKVDRHFERNLKNQKHAKRFCPICQGFINEHNG